MQHKIALLLLLFLSAIFTTAYADDPSNPQDTSTWKVTTAGYSDNVVLTAVIEIEGLESRNASDKVGAFVGNDCRGVASAIYVPAIDRYIVSMLIYANTTGETVNFYVYTGQGAQILPATTSFVFDPSEPMGSLAEPDTIKTVRLEIGVTKTDVLCAADSTGSISLQVTGGQPPYAYLWSNGASTPDVTGLPAGTYYFTVTDSNNFSKSDSVKIINTNRTIIAPTLTAVPSPVVCAGSNVYAFAYSAEATPLYQWFNIFDSLLFEGDLLLLSHLTAPTQVYARTNVHNCLSATVPLAIDVLPAPDATYTLNTNTPAIQDTVVFIPASVVAGFTYSWNFGDGATAMGPNVKHTYTNEGIYLTALTVSSPAGCSATFSVPVSVNSGNIDVLVDIIPAFCDGSATGQVTAQAINGRPPYQYHWSTGSTSNMIGSLAPGTYMLTVIDANGVSVVVTATVSSNTSGLTPPLVLANLGQPVCPGDGFWAAAVSGNNGAQYFWYDAATGGALVFVGNLLFVSESQQDLSLYVESRVGGCVSTTRTPVNVQLVAFDARFEASRYTAPPSTSITFTANSVLPGYQYFWQFGNGDVGNGASVTYSYPQTGQFIASLTVTSPQGCELSQEVLITIESNLQVILQVTRPECPYQNTGVISSQVLNGTPPFTYQWSTGATTPSISNINQGQYSLTVTDANNQTTTVTTTVTSLVYSVSPPTFAINGSDPVCRGDDVWITASSNIPDAEYYWYGSASGNDLIFVGNPMIIYNIQSSQQFWVETRYKGCLSSTRAGVTVNVTAPSAAFQISTTSAAVGQFISFTGITVLQGYTYLWNFGNGISGIINQNNYAYQYNLPGLYEFSLTVTAPNGCSDTRKQWIYIYAPVFDPPDNGSGALGIVFDVTPTYCAQQGTGSIQASAINGTPPYSFHWSTGSTSSSIGGLQPGVYTLTVTDSESHSIIGTAQIFSQIGTIAAPTVSINGGYKICEGDAAWLAASSASGQATYYWYDEALGGDLINVGPTLFISSVVERDTFYVEARLEGCSVSTRTMVVVKPTPIFTGFSATPMVVPEGGTITFKADTLVQGHSYNWVFGDGNTDIGLQVTNTYLHQGTYEVTLIVVTEDSCTAQRKLFINVYPEPNSTPLVLLNPTNVQCPDDASGSINAQAFGGTPPYSYAWSNGATEAHLIGLLPGQYSVTVTDALGQTTTAETSILSVYANLAAPEVLVNGNLKVCKGESAWIAANSDYPNATYYWWDSPFGGDLVYVGNPLVLNNLQANQLLFAETHIGGCVSSTTTPLIVEVVEPNSDFTASALVAPAGTSIDFSAVDPSQISYAWDFGDAATGAGASVSHTFTDPGIYVVTLKTSIQTGCNSETTHIIRITPANGGLQAVMSVVDVSCGGMQNGAVNLAISGGIAPYQVSWSDGATGQARAGLTEGNYEFTITDDAGNTLTDIANVGAQTPLIELPEVVANGNQPLCAGEPFLLVASNNVSNPEYRWYDAPTDGNLVFVGPAFPISGLFQNQSVYVEAFYHGCFSAGRTQVDLDVEAVNAEFTASEVVINLGNAVQLDPVDIVVDNTYEWDFGDGLGSTAASVNHIYNAPGIYQITLKVTGPNGCVAVHGIQVEVINNLQMAVIMQVTDNACPGGATGAISAQVVNGTPPFTYAWNNGLSSSTVTNLSAGSYVVTVTDAMGIEVVQQAVVDEALGIDQLDAPVVFLSGGNQVCPGSSVNLFAMTNQPGIPTFNWYDSPQGGNLVNIGAVYNLFAPTASEHLYVETVLNGCLSESRTHFVLQVDNPNQGFTASTNFLFENEFVTLTPVLQNAGNTYEWFFGDGTTSNDVPANHAYTYPDLFDVSLQVTSANGCTVLHQEPDYINVISSTQLTLILDVDPIPCQGGNNGSINALVFNGLPPYQYLWSTGATTPQIGQLSPGNYSLTLTDSGGLMATAQTTVTELHSTPPTPGIVWNGGSTVCAGSDVALQASSTMPVDSFFWYGSTGDLLHVGNVLVIDDIQAGGNFYLESHANGCISEQSSLALAVQTLDASFSLSTSQAIQVGSAMTFTPSVATYTSYSWDFGDGNTSSTMSPVYSYSQVGHFDVSLTVTNADGCSATFSMSNAVQVIDANSLAATFAIEHALCDADHTGSIEALTTGGEPPYQYLWSNGATGAIASGLAAGDYQLTITDNLGNTFISAVTVDNLGVIIPTPDVLVNGNLPVCKGETAFLLANTNGFPAVTYQWYSQPAGGQTLYSGPLYLLPNLQSDQTLFCEANVNGCVSTRATVAVAVQAPNAAFGITPNINTIDEGSLVHFVPDEMHPDFTYQWQFGDNGWSNLPQPYYIYNLPGTFNVSLVVTDADGCSDMAMYPSYITVMPVSDPLVEEEVEDRSGSLGPHASTFGATAYPNPFEDQFTLVLENRLDGNFDLILTDVNGRQIMYQPISLKAGKHQLQVETAALNLSSGTYILFVRKGDEWGSLQMIKK